jgi:hypothetical protein
MRVTPVPPPRVRVTPVPPPREPHRPPRPKKGVEKLFSNPYDQ